MPAENTPDRNTIPLTYATIYGPYAFGVVSLLLIWFSIVRPELSRNKIDFEANQAVAISLTQHDLAQKEIVDTMQKTSQSLEMTAKILERMLQHLDSENKTNQD